MFTRADALPRHGHEDSDDENAGCLSCAAPDSMATWSGKVNALKTHDRATADLHVFSATFRTVEGATAALCQLGDARGRGLIDLENAVALTRARAGGIEFLQSEAFPGWPGHGSGAYIMGILPLCFAHDWIESVDRVTFLARLHAAGFEDEDLRALAEDLVWGSSLLMAVIDRRLVEAVDDILNEVAVKIGWALMTATVAHLVQQSSVAWPGSVAGS